MLEKKMPKIIPQNSQIFDTYKYLFIQIFQEINKEEIMEFKNHHSLILNEFLYIGSDRHSY